MRSPATCPICQSETSFVTTRRGEFVRRDFEIYLCPRCGFAFVANPWTDYDRIYDERYYFGEGADPLINYLEEAADPRSLRRYEWRGIEKWVRRTARAGPQTRWLDFGAGSGGLVNYLRTVGYAHVVGYDTSSVAPKVPGYEDFSLPDLPNETSFEVITAIEVIEHVPEPLAVLRRLRRLLVPGGKLFITTTNSAPYKARLNTWRYIIPEIHVSFFDPPGLARALREAGFDVAYPGYTDGWTDIVRFKLLKNIGIGHSSVAEALIPWPIVARLIDWRLKLSAQPIGCA